MRRTVEGLQSARMKECHQWAGRAMVELRTNKHERLGNRYPVRCLQIRIKRVLVLLSIKAVTCVASQTKGTFSDIEMT